MPDLFSMQSNHKFNSFSPLESYHTFWTLIHVWLTLKQKFSLQQHSNISSHIVVRVWYRKYISNGLNSSQNSRSDTLRLFPLYATLSIAIQLLSISLSTKYLTFYLTFFLIFRQIVDKIVIETKEVIVPKLLPLIEFHWERRQLKG